MEIIKFDLEELKKNLNGFSCYILGRSYDLEENGVTEDFPILPITPRSSTLRDRFILISILPFGA